VEILFKTAKLEKLCNNHQKAIKKWGDRQARLLMRRLDDIRAAPSLEAFRTLPGRCHELLGDRTGQLTLDLVHPDRLVFEAADNPAPQRPDGGLDWSRVRAVRILAVEDTHG
jgi:proteic killer suppression protein